MVEIYGLFSVIACGRVYLHLYNRLEADRRGSLRGKDLVEPFKTCSHYILLVVRV